MTQVYKIHLDNGRFDHVATKRAAILRAIEMAGAPAKTDETTLDHDWGVEITRVSRSVARAVGIHV